MGDVFQPHPSWPSARAIDSLRHHEWCHSFARRGARPAVRRPASYRLQGAGVRGDFVLAAWTGDSRTSSLQQNQVSVAEALFSPLLSQYQIEHCFVGSHASPSCHSVRLVRVVLRWRWIWSVSGMALTVGKRKCWEKNMPYCHFFHHKSHSAWSGSNSGLHVERPYPWRSLAL